MSTWLLRPSCCSLASAFAENCMLTLVLPLRFSNGDNRNQLLEAQSGGRVWGRETPNTVDKSNTDIVRVGGVLNAD